VNRKPGNYAVGDTRFFEFEWFKSVVDPSLQLDCCRDEWVIRWGFYYETDREGDFIVLGPTGGVLVLEVKGGDLRKLSTAGRWEGSSRDHPVARAELGKLGSRTVGGRWRRMGRSGESCRARTLLRRRRAGSHARDPCDELIVPRFDALVVDEAQDHDTRWPGSESGKTDSGWWEITGNFFGKTRMRQWQFSTIKPKGPSFAKRSGSKPRAS